MTFHIRFIPRVKKDLANIPESDIRMIKDGLKSLSLSEDPQRHIKKLKGQSMPLYSFRIGNYRVIMLIERTSMVIFMVEISQRKNVYRRY
ncbi:MAG TPA: type II toxin-antitoxin system RelE/ParE family toxin [Methanoregulaceae archaeon]|nr:type II toxin-antitoxin system RelE/ParE family toxin [Methanoregulaceae archaeon]